MEHIIYRKTLDVHKNGIQFMLQGFETADKMSRVIEISLMASGDAIDFPLEKVEALMYIRTPKATEPSINKCTIKDNKVVYDVLPIVEEGITTMQLKIIETSVDGAKSVLAAPKFAVEVTKSDADDESAEQNTTFTALEDAMSKAKSVYDERFLRMELSSDCVFRAYYADGSVYETDFLKRLFLNGNALLSESFAHGGTETRAGEDTDNSMYYSNVARSEALKAKDIMENSNAIREEVKLHGVYTAFAVDFESGEVEYISPSFKFKVNPETGNLDAIGQTYTLDAEIYRIVDEWLESNGVVLSELQAISTTHTQRLFELKVLTETHSEQIDALNHEVGKITPIEKGGTGANNVSDALKNLGAASDDLSNVTNESLKTKNIAQFKTGSYVGNGTAGVDYPNTLTFDFEPIFVMVYDEQGINAGGTGSSTLWGVHYTKGQTRQHTFGTDSSDYIYYTVNGNSFSWYHANNESGKQCNESGKTYYYIAIG